MNEFNSPAERKENPEEFRRQIRRKEERKVEARKRRDRGVWFGLGMFGLVGWSVAIPSLIGLAIGIWIDSRWRGGYSWTLMGLFIGVVLGCLNAWFWVKRETDRD